MVCGIHFSLNLGHVGVMKSMITPNCNQNSLVMTLQSESSPDLSYVSIIITVILMKIKSLKIKVRRYTIDYMTNKTMIHVPTYHAMF